MPFGPGKYDDACTAARLATGADACILIIVGGSKGEGFSVQATTDVPPRVLATLLLEVAKQLDAAARRDEG